MEPTPISSLNTVAQKARGFTLIEMLVVLGIMSVLSLVVLTGQSTFNKSLILNDTAYSVAFTARQAQTYGISSRKNGAVNNTGYGLYFDRTTLDRYALYADTDKLLGVRAWCPVGVAGRPDAKLGDCLYRANYDFLIKNNIFTRGFKIQKFCAKTIGGVYACTSGTGTVLNTLNVVFLRPNTTTLISALYNGLYYQAKCAEIYIQEPGGTAFRTVRISQFGEISMNQICS